MCATLTKTITYWAAKSIAKSVSIWKEKMDTEYLLQYLGRYENE